MKIRAQSSQSYGALIALCMLPAMSYAADEAIQQVHLDEGKAQTIYISTQVPTTLVFPFITNNIDGVNVTTDSKKKAVALMSYKPGNSFLSIRALEETGICGLNVVQENHVYVLQFVVSEKKAMRAVKFLINKVNGIHHTGKMESRRVSPAHLLKLLDQAKAYSLISAQHPERDGLMETVYPHHEQHFLKFKVQIEQIFRFEEEDTLIFRIRLMNKTLDTIYYLPQALAVRVGANVYTASIADASGQIPSFEESIAYFGITGTPRGGRANLSLKNGFQVIVEESPESYILKPNLKEEKEL